MSALELDEHRYSFFREDRRRRRLKTQLDCGCWIDGTEPYRYIVWRVASDPPNTIRQRTDCEFCARDDQSY